MADRQTLLDLAKRCEEASGPLYAIERDIADALDFPGIPKNYTVSLDAAMTLVPAGCTEGGMTWEPEGCRVELQMPTQVCSGTGATPALALTAAALRALAAMEPSS